MPVGQSGGLITYVTVSSATTNATLVYGRPCHLDLFSGFNTNASARFVKIYDTATAPLSATSGYAPTPPIASFGLPGNASGAGSNVPVSPALPTSGGIQLFAGLAFTITANISLSDNSAVSAGDVLLTLGYR